MNKNSNTYIIAYSTILVVVVAAVLSYAAISLRPKQEANVLIEKKGAILASIGEGKDAASAPEGKDKYIDAQYDKYIKASYFVNAAGDATAVEAREALDALSRLPEVFGKKEAMPVFQAEVSGKILYVIPLTGKGLWGPVWGYIALNQDCTTINGAVFDHKSETPGLGAEIATPVFSDQFVGKQIFENGKFASISLTKGKGSSEGNPYAVDAISGGTLTSNGVRDMLKTCIGDYVPYFEKMMKNVEQPENN
ncbi:Na(+)-translocating NADH-quinone reductase subunit C [Mucinivorans hirudinis]|uniref:Na(+)-translocating NADH-quinone reductase subunit C n=1 Tax=Mucinivorans hirudinis TaxID=1433126 RepID=A0A060R7Y0_9BACT|nr:Na(+)-translocating NADH-quinone reductase subunit C [Mucinivorans hirudinis]